MGLDFEIVLFLDLQIQMKIWQFKNYYQSAICRENFDKFNCESFSRGRSAKTIGIDASRTNRCWQGKFQAWFSDGFLIF